MLINETSKVTNLTKKAIEYYMEHQLVVPNLLENGYRDFRPVDIIRLNKISVLRKLGLTIEEIKKVLENENDEVLKKLSVQKELDIQRTQEKNAILEKLSCGKSYEEISLELNTIEQNATITEKLLDAFPGYYGRFICLHFARFLNEPMIAEEQKSAYQEIITFLDNTPPLTFPKEMQEYINESTNQISTSDITKMIEKTKQSVEDPEAFYSDNKELLEYYISFMQSDEYKNSPAYHLQSLLKTFNKTNGYNDIFIPAMKKLSPSYAEYYRQTEIANEKLLELYPEIEKIDNM